MRAADPARAQAGHALLEFSLVLLLGLVPMVLGILQVTALLVAHDVLALATFQAARQGAMAGADPEALRSALARGLLPLYVPTARDGRVPLAQAAAGHARALAEVRTLDAIAVLEPTRAQLRPWLIARGGRQVLPNEAIESRPAAFRAASVLTLATTHCQPLVVPLVGPALAQMLTALEGAAGRSGAGGAGSAGGASARCLAAGRAPLSARASVVLQSDLPLDNLPATEPVP